MTLLPHHQELLRGSAISDEVIAERGYFSVERKSEPRRLGFTAGLQYAPTLVMPIHGVVAGDEPWFVHRPDVTPVMDGRPRKYLIPKGRPMALDVHPRVQPGLRKRCPLFVTEGSKKADALITAGAEAVISVIGVWNWRGRNDDGGLAMLPDWEFVALKEGRTVYVVYDSDAILKQPVSLAMNRLGAALQRMGAAVSYVHLPCGPNGSKVGADDFLAAGHDLSDIVRLARVSPPEPASAPKQQERGSDGPLRPTAELTAEVAAVFDQYIILPSRSAVLAIALWVLHTWAFEAAHCTPYLIIESPTKRAAKTRVLEVGGTVVRAPWTPVAPSEAALYRKIEKERPTLLLDEVDAVFGRA